MLGGTEHRGRLNAPAAAGWDHRYLAAEQWNLAELAFERCLTWAISFCNCTTIVLHGCTQAPPTACFRVCAARDRRIADASYVIMPWAPGAAAPIHA